MSFPFSLRAVFLALLFALLPLSAQAQQQTQGYATPNWPNLMRTMVRFNALDLTDTYLVDEYSIVTECELYKAFYKNDFKWNQVRDAVRKSVDINIATFPTAYHYDIQLQLDRYDFAAKMFRFTNKSTIHNVNTFALYSVNGNDCGTADIKYIPRTFRAVISAPIYMDGLPLAEKDAQALLKLMTDDQNDSRIIFAKFNLQVVYIEPWRRIRAKGEGGNMLHFGQTTDGGTAARIDSRLESIDFFEDEQNTHLIYHYQP